MDLNKETANTKTDAPSPTREPMLLDGLIFDKDGTLFDFSASWESWALALVSELAEGDAARHEVICHAIGFDNENRCFRPDSIVIAHTADEIAAAVEPLQDRYDYTGWWSE